MQADLYQRASEVFLRLCDHPVGERARLLEESCGDDSELRKQVEAMLRNDDAFATFDEDDSHAVVAREQLADLGPPGRLEGQAIDLPLDVDGYRLLRRLGQGGMGVVYEAEQDNPARRVALKLIRPELAIGRSTERFDAEIRAHARLEHPGISRMYAAGTLNLLGHPQPYFAMELVRGRPLITAADARELDLPARLELLARICETVQYAHQQGVIHRDLKPENILLDQHGDPKVLDFGVARITDLDAAKLTRMTGSGQLLGTLAYMSPEQLDGDGHPDTRSDIYSLGMIGFELLTGELPYRIRKASLIETLRRITQDEPQRLSHFDARMRGDLDVIFAKALARDRGQRYDSASALANDLRRFVRNEPISARPLGSVYQLRKLVQRNTALSAALLTIFLVTATAGIVSTWLALRAMRAEQLATDQANAARDAQADAESQAAKYLAVNDFLSEYLLSRIDPDHDGRDVLMLDVVEQAAAALEAEPIDEPEVEASIRLALGRSFTSLGDYERGRAFIERAVELGRSIAPGSPATLTSELELVVNRWRRERLDEADELLNHVIAGFEQVEAADSGMLLRARAVRGTLRLSQGRYAEAEQVLAPVIAALEAQPDLISQLLSARHNLASAYRHQGKLNEALDELTAVVAAEEAEFGRDARQTLQSRHNLASLLRARGDFEEAEVELREVLAGQQEALGEEHPDTLMSLTTLGLLLKETQRPREALPILRETYDTATALLGPEHTQTLMALNNLAITHDDLREYEQSEPLLREVLQRLGDSLGSVHPHTLNAMNNLAASLRSQGRLQDALELFLQTLEGQQKTLGEDAIPTLITYCQLGSVYGKLGEIEAAREHATRGRDGLVAKFGAEHGYARRAEQILAEVIAAEGADEQEGHGTE